MWILRRADTRRSQQYHIHDGRHHTEPRPWKRVGGDFRIGCAESTHLHDFSFLTNASNSGPGEFFVDQPMRQIGT